MSTPKERPIFMSGEMVKALLDGRKTQTRRVVKWKPYPGYTGNLQWHGMTLGNPSTGNIESGWCLYSKGGACWNQRTEAAFCHYGKSGDRLWVRETFRVEGWRNEGTLLIGFKDGRTRTCDNVGEWDRYAIQATDQCAAAQCPQDGEGYYQWRRKEDCPVKWKPSIYMPRWASRLTLELTAVRVERVQDISGEDCLSEGVRIPVSTDGKLLVRLSGDFKPADYIKKHPRDWTPTEALRAEYASLWDLLNAKRGYGWDKNPFVWVLEFKRL